MPLPTNIDASYDDDPTRPSRQLHQAHHDALHAFHNLWEGIVPASLETPAGAQAKVDAHRDVAAPHVGHETPAGAQAKVDTEAAARAAADALLLPKAGGTMTGALVLPGDAAAALQATPLQQVQALIAALVDAAPGTLDTLNELAAALGDDPNFATTITNALAGKQPLDADLTAIAALTTTAYGRAFLGLVDAAAGRTALGLGTAAVEAASAFQPADSDLTAIAALTTTAYGRAFLALADAAGGRTALALGTAATADKVAAGAAGVLDATDPTTTNARTPTAHAVDGALHTAAGLTAGHVMRATGATTFAFGAVADADLPATIQRKTEKDANGGYAGLANPQGTRDGTKFLRDDGTWQAAGGAAEVGSMFAGIDNRVAYAAQFGPNQGYDEEFDGANVADGTLPANWVNLSMEAAAVYRQWFGAGRVDWGGGGDNSNLQIVARTLPATTTFDAMMHLWGAAATEAQAYTAMAVLHNSVNGRTVTFGCFNASTTDKTPDFYVSYYADVDTSSAALAGPTTIVPNVGLHGYFWIRKLSDSSYSFLWSPDGGCFFTVGAAINVQAATNGLDGDPTHIGFALNTPGAAHVGCEWLRIRNLT